MGLAQRCAASLAVLVLAAQAAAQTPVTTESYVETYRPKAASAPAGKASAAIGKWKSKKTEDNLLAVKPFAEAGDPAAIRAMMEGYQHLLASPKDRTASAALADPAKGLIPLAGLYAARLYPIEGPKKDVITAIIPCFKGGYSYPRDWSSTFMQISSVSNGLDCGFDTQGEAWALKPLNDFQKGQKITTRPDLTFPERPVGNQADIDAARAKQLVASYGNTERIHTLTPEEVAWLTSYASTRSDVQKSWDETRFSRDLKRELKGQQPLDPAFYKAWVAGPGKQARDSAFFHQQHERQNAAASFDTNLGKATLPFQLESLRETAWREGGQKAEDLWLKLRAIEGPSRTDVYRFCDAGSRTACDDVKFLAQMAERDKELAKEAAARNHHISDAAAGSLRTAEEMTQALKDHNTQVNRENCARADLGASIACGR